MKQALLLRKSKFVVPLVVLGAAAYIDFASCYIIAWQEVYLHQQHASAIVFWVLLAIFHVFGLFYWALIFIRGPGKIPKFKNFDLYGTKDSQNAPVPDAFICDEQGFPYWCSKCQNLKPNRSFHLNDLGTCVPRFDHFCLWIGTAIGRDNYVPFVKFLQSLSAYSVLILCYVATFTRSSLRHDSSKLPHFIILFILSAFGAIFSVSLLIGVVKYTFTNATSFDEITRRQMYSYNKWSHKRQKVNPKHAWCLGKPPRIELGIRFVNIAHDGTRKVVSFSVGDSPYSNGFRVNLVNTYLNNNVSSNLTKDFINKSYLIKASVVATVPFSEFFIASISRSDDLVSFQSNTDEFSPAFMQKILQKVEKNEFKYALYLYPVLPT